MIDQTPQTSINIKSNTIKNSLKVNIRHNILELYFLEYNLTLLRTVQLNIHEAVNEHRQQ